MFSEINLSPYSIFIMKPIITNHFFGTPNCRIMRSGSKQSNSSQKFGRLNFFAIDLMQGKKVNELALCHSPI
jgi:hypothetical protein